MPEAGSGNRECATFPGLLSKLSPTWSLKTMHIYSRTFPEARTLKSRRLVWLPSFWSPGGCGGTHFPCTRGCLPSLAHLSFLHLHSTSLRPLALSSLLVFPASLSYKDCVVAVVPARKSTGTSPSKVLDVSTSTQSCKERDHSHLGVGGRSRAQTGAVIPSAAGNFT